MRIGIILAVLLALCPAAAAVQAAGAPLSPAVIAQDIHQGRFDGSYPLFDFGAGVPAERELSKAVTGEVQRFLGVHDQPEYSGKISYTLEYQNPEFISVRLTEFAYMERAAHPMTYWKTYTADARTGKIYALKDFFRSDIDYRAILSDMVRDKIAERNINLLTPFQGIDDKQEFFLTPNGIVIYYQLYAYTAYAYGFLQIEIPYADIRDLLDADMRARVWDETK